MPTPPKAVNILEIDKQIVKQCLAAFISNSRRHAVRLTKNPRSRVDQKLPTGALKARRILGIAEIREMLRVHKAALTYSFGGNEDTVTDYKIDFPGSLGNGPDRLMRPVAPAASEGIPHRRSLKNLVRLVP